MPRISIAARVTMITLVGILSVWLITLAWYYRLGPGADQKLTPDPGWVAALADILEVAPPALRSALIDDVASTGEVAVSLDDTPLPAGPHGDGGLTARYAAALGDRRFTVESLEQRGFSPLQIIAALGSTRPSRLRVALATGATLVIDVRPTLVNRFGLPVGLVAGLLGTLIALVTLVLMHRELRPVARLAVAADKIDFTSAPTLLPVPRAAAPEVRSLVTALNTLQTRLSTLLRARMAMLGGISHDVRTFATRLRLRVESLEGPQRERAITDIEDMVRLLDDALLASRIGAGELVEELVEFDALLRAELEDRRAAGRPLSLLVEDPARGALILGDPLALRRIVGNLIDNALQYGGVAHVTLRATDETVILMVDDEGPGIPPTERDLLLEPFVRRETSRSRATGGAGLGLSVVRSLVDGHRGEFSIDDAPTGGARMVVRLERFAPSGP